MIFAIFAPIPNSVNMFQFKNVDCMLAILCKLKNKAKILECQRFLIDNFRIEVYCFLKSSYIRNRLKSNNKSSTHRHAKITNKYSVTGAQRK